MIEKIISLMSNSIFITCILFILCIVICSLSTLFKKDKFFYEPNEISGELLEIDNIKNEIYNEIVDIYAQHKNWVDWPEKDLYANTGSWEIFPFYAFNIWVDQNCKQCPILYNYLKSIKGLKLATLSKMTPGMKLKPHRGWGKHSNHVIRCHYGLIVPNGCYISVSDTVTPPLYKQNKKYKLSNCPNTIKYNDINTKEHEEIRFHRQFKWLVFDDSKTHYSENMSEKNRIVLIIDIDRPTNIKIGNSAIGDSKELLNIIEYYKKNNIQSITNHYDKKIDAILYGI